MATNEAGTAVPTKEELLALLRAGKVKEFNQVRPYPKVDLSWANLQEADLSGANFSRANFSVADLSGANFSVADLSGAKLLRANLQEVDLSGANLSGANFWGANLWGCRGLSEEQRELILDQLKKSWR